MPLSTTDIKALCEVYDADLTDFEKILKVEQAVFPMIQDKQKQSQADKE